MTQKQSWKDLLRSYNHHHKVCWAKPVANSQVAHQIYKLVIFDEVTLLPGILRFFEGLVWWLRLSQPVCQLNNVPQIY